jgi:predicted small lipoprotein YifL
MQIRTTTVRRSFVVAMLCMLAACGSDGAAKTDAPPAPKNPVSKADADALRKEIYPLWNPPAEPPCHQQMKIRIDIAEDGSVVRADAKPELAYDDPCRGAQDAAIRAVWAASPLNVPRHREWSSLTLVFDRDALP